MYESGSSNGGAPDAVAELPSTPMPAFAVRAKSPADEATAAILLELLGTIRENIPEAIAGKDPEALHELRVAVRISRAFQRELKDVFPREELQRFREDFKWLQRLSNPVRDLDVLIAELEAEAEADPEQAADLKFSIRALSKRRTAQRRKLRSGLTGARATKLLLDWEALLKALPQLDTADRPAATKSISSVVAKRIRKRYKKIIAMGDDLDDDLPSAQLHELRKRSKDLRSLLKFTGEFYPKKVVKPLKSDFSDLHDVLGTLQDRVVQRELLTETADELVAAQTRAGALLAIGGAIEIMRLEQLQARDDFEDCFDELSKRKRRKAVRAAFS